MAAKRNQKVKKRGCAGFSVKVMLGAVCYTAVLVMVFLITLFRMTSSSEIIEMPELVGSMRHEVEPAWAERGLYFDVIDESCSEPEGLILEQSIPAGQHIKLNHRVEVTVSRGREERPVPDLINLPLDFARELLEKEGLAVGTVTEVDEEAEGILPGAIISISPQSGTMLALGEPVDLVVRKEQRYAMIKVPALLGHRLEDIEGVLRTLGLSFAPESVETRTDYDHLPGTILEQSPAPGTTVPGGTQLQLVVAEQRTSSSPTRMVPLYFVTPPGLGEYEVKVMVSDRLGQREVFRENSAPGRHIMLQLRVSGEAYANIYIGGELHRTIPLE